VDFSQVQIGEQREHLLEPINGLRYSNQADFVRADIKSLKVAGDIVRLSQVLRNLISNALKFTPENEKVIIRVDFADDIDSIESARVEAIHANEGQSANSRSICKSIKSLKSRSHSSTKYFTNLRSGRSCETVSTSPPESTKIVLSNKETYHGIKKGFVVVHVEDYGEGMTEEQLMKVFGEGTQFNVNALQAGNGSGLGLYIAKGIAEQHGGSLTVSSPGIGKGTTFTLMVPLYQLIDDSKVEIAALGTARLDCVSSGKEGKPLLGNRKEKKLHVLVVDDAVSNRKMLSRILKNRGHTCEQAADGQEAVIQYLRSEMIGPPFDTIIMDGDMPVMTGPEAAKLMRELGCQYLITGLTGNVLPEDVANYVTKGANGVLPKPLNVDDLENLWSNHKVMPKKHLTLAQRKARTHYALMFNIQPAATAKDIRDPRTLPSVLDAPGSDADADAEDISSSTSKDNAPTTPSPRAELPELENANKEDPMCTVAEFSVDTECSIDLTRSDSNSGYPQSRGGRSTSHWKVLPLAIDMV
jgi:CheY-like chemotaxis protein